MYPRDNEWHGEYAAEYNHNNPPATTTPPDMDGLVERLENERPTSMIAVLSLHLEAADAIEALSSALASERAAHAAKDAEIARLTAEKDAAEFAARNSKSLDGDALHAVRALLDSAGVPKAAFIDDHVGNAIAQRDAERSAHAETKRERDDAMKALDALLELNDNHSPFDGELHQDRVDRAWDAARRVREGGEANGN